MRHHLSAGLRQGLAVRLGTFRFLHRCWCVDGMDYRPSDITCQSEFRCLPIFLSLAWWNYVIWEFQMGAWYETSYRKQEFC